MNFGTSVLFILLMVCPFLSGCLEKSPGTNNPAGNSSKGEPLPDLNKPPQEVKMPDSIGSLVLKATQDVEMVLGIANPLPGRLESSRLKLKIKDASESLQSLQSAIADTSLAKEANEGLLGERARELERLRGRLGAIQEELGMEVGGTMGNPEDDIQELEQIFDWWYSPRVDVKIKQMQALLEDEKWEVETLAFFEQFQFLAAAMEERKGHLEQQVLVAGKVSGSVKKFIDELKGLLSKAREYQLTQEFDWQPTKMTLLSKELKALSSAWEELEKREGGLGTRSFQLSLGQPVALRNDSLSEKLVNYRFLLERTCAEFAWAVHYLTLAKDYHDGLARLHSQIEETSPFLTGDIKATLDKAKVSLYESQGSGELATDADFYGHVLIDSNAIASALLKGFNSVYLAMEEFRKDGEHGSKAVLQSAILEFLGSWRLHGCPPVTFHRDSDNPKLLRLVRCMAVRETLLGHEDPLAHRRFMLFASFQYFQTWRTLAHEGNPSAISLLAANYKGGYQRPVSWVIGKSLLKLAGQQDNP